MKLRLILNGDQIFTLTNDTPIIIPVNKKDNVVVATDGYHYTSPLRLKYDQPSYYRFKLTCAIDDLQLIGGLFILLLLYLVGFMTGVFLIKLFSFFPLVYFLVLYYLNRKDFIRFRAVQ